MNQKHEETIYHTNLYINSMVENENQIKSGITINVDVSAKIQRNIMHAKMILSGILIHALVKMANNWGVLLGI